MAFVGPNISRPSEPSHKVTKKQRLWTGDELQWIGLLRSELLLDDGAKRRAVRLGRETQFREVTIPELTTILKPEAMQEALALFDGQSDPVTALQWLVGNMLPKKRRTARYPLAVAKRFGIAALRDKPKLHVGTIHSFKGGEADSVILIPDLSRAGMVACLEGGKDRSAVIRLCYVGITRAREKLTLCEPVSYMHVDIIPAWR